MLSYNHTYHNKAPNYHLTLSLVFVHCFFFGFAQLVDDLFAQSCLTRQQHVFS